jgi:hypothetical protein
VKTQLERRAQKKDTKSIKEIHVHLNLQPPLSPIASEGEESPEIESFEERLVMVWVLLTLNPLHLPLHLKL